MENSIREYSGRTFSPEEITLIQWTVKRYPRLSRNEMAKTICEFLEWKQPSGKSKTTQCVSLLVEMEKTGLVDLPPVQTHSRRKKPDPSRKEETVTKKEASNGLLSEEEATITGAEKKAAQENGKPHQETAGPTQKQEEVMDEVRHCGKIELKIPESSADKNRWRTCMQRYHMLGHSEGYGARLKYFIQTEGKDIGCLQFTASAWALSARDKWIGWTEKDKKARLHLVINNSRFLVLPWVHVNNLGSRVLSLAAQQIQKDWLRVYYYVPVMLESFVDTAYYQGTSYKAANWVYLGHTQGRGRNDRYEERLLTKKAIYVYPLEKKFREILKGELPCKAVCPDE